MPPKVISGGDNPYDIHDAKLSSSATAHESSSVTAHEISNTFHQVHLMYVGMTGSRQMATARYALTESITIQPNLNSIIRKC